MCKLCEFSVQKVTPPPKLIIDREFIRHWWGFACFEHQRQYEPSQFSLNWNSPNFSLDIKIGSQVALSHQNYSYTTWLHFQFLDSPIAIERNITSKVFKVQVWVIKHRVRKTEMFWERHVIECQVMMTEQIAQLDIWPCLMHRNIIPLTAHLDLS